MLKSWEEEEQHGESIKGDKAKMISNASVFGDKYDTTGT